METEETSRSSDKTSKKGRKRIKTLTAEQEARRREELKEQLRERLELERRALKVVERLLEDSVTRDVLVDSARFISPANYRDAVEERSLTKLCGYPLCANQLGKIPTQQFKISTKTNRVYDITERKLFCCNFCYKASKEFELQISKTPLWLRQHESPQEIKLLNKGDGGSSGEEVLLSGIPLREEDIENPLASAHDEASSSQQSCDGPVCGAGSGHGSESGGDGEQEQHKRRVHWDDLPKRSNEDSKGKQGLIDMRKKLMMEGCENETEWHQSQTKEREEEIRLEIEVKELPKPHTHQAVKEETEMFEDRRVEEATAKLNACSLSEMVLHNAHLPEDTSTQTEPQPYFHPSPRVIESKPPPSSALTVSSQDFLREASSEQPSLNVTQVGMSRRGAAGLRHLLKKQPAEAEAAQLNILEGLRRTLKEWCTDETIKFLYGTDHSLASSFTDVKEETAEDLDEDDLEDDCGEQKRPDYEALQKESQQMELRVREFYRGTWLLPGEETEATVQDQSRKDPDLDRSGKDLVLPLIDSHSQHVIQKKITVEKLISCLRNIVGPLSLSMSDVTTDLNNLVRTFRFTNTSIMHKTPEWTLIAVVLLHLLSEVSPAVQESLHSAASLEFLKTLMEEVGLKEQDLLNLVDHFKPATRRQLICSS